MRAQELLSTLEPPALRKLATALKADSADQAAIADAMRSVRAGAALMRACTSAVMREDVALLCANPFDTVAVDELVEPSAFTAIGFLIQNAAGEYEVNLDMALSAIRQTPLEFGFFPTLLARLSDAERIKTAKSLEIGPRPTIVDHILDISAALTDPAKLMRTVARLRESEREVVLDALALGELPDELDGFPLDSPAPTVTLDPGAAGRFGLVFWFEHEASGVEARPVVPLEIVETLARALEQVPPPPEVVAAKARKRPGTTTRRPRKKAEEPTPAPVPDALAQSGSGRAVDAVFRRASELAPSGANNPFRDPLAGSGGMPRATGPGSRLAGSGGMAPVDPLSTSSANSPFRLGRVSSIRAASAIVDVETAKVAEAVLGDPELASSVLEVVSESLVVLRVGVNARDWAEDCALRLGL